MADLLARRRFMAESKITAGYGSCPASRRLMASPTRAICVSLMGVSS
ncbi:hypothetical protein [Streptomyces thermoalcalitolerans]